MLRERWQSQCNLEEANEDYLEVCFEGLVVGENYVWRLVIFVIFIAFGIAKRSGDALKSSFRITMQALVGVGNYGEGRRGFYGLCDTAVLKLCYKPYRVL